MDRELQASRSLQAGLRQALADGGLGLIYQPVLEVRGHGVVAVEALLRWRHPGGGEVPPATFIPVAEASGLIQPLGAWTLRQACRQAAAWRAAGLKVAVTKRTGLGARGTTRLAKDSDLIRGQWHELLRLAASVRTGTISASLMLKQLGSYPRQNRLAAALREVGRVGRTLWALQWIEDPEVCRATELEQYKGEARNALARAVCLHRLRRFRDRSLESQTTRASALNLDIAAVILWNMAYLHRAVMAFRARGELIDAALLARLAPLGWGHVAITSDYVWEEAPALDANGFRPSTNLSLSAEPYN